jgi:hypothetical protein
MLEVTKKQMDWMEKARMPFLIAISATGWRVIDIMKMLENDRERLTDRI